MVVTVENQTQVKLLQFLSHPVFVSENRVEFCRFDFCTVESSIRLCSAEFHVELSITTHVFSIVMLP